MKKKVVVVVLLFLSLILCLIGFVRGKAWEAEHIELPLQKGIKVAHISDLHYPYVGIKEDTLLSILIEEKPDFIFLTGDIFHDDEKNHANGEFFERLAKIAPTYAVLGNHEIGSKYLGNYRLFYKKLSIRLLENTMTKVFVKGVPVTLVGLSDAYGLSSVPNIHSINASDFVLLLAHRPEKGGDYFSSDIIDVAFSGHAHGGQARLGKMALYAPDQGFFPKYTSGEYGFSSSYLIVSRGLGSKQIRFNNPFHLVIVNM